MSARVWPPCAQAPGGGAGSGIAGLPMAVIGRWLFPGARKAAVACSHRAVAVCLQGFVVLNAPSSLAAASPWLASSWCSPRSTWPCASGRSNSGIRWHCGPGGLARLTAAAHTGRRGPYRPPRNPPFRCGPPTRSQRRSGERSNARRRSTCTCTASARRTSPPSSPGEHCRDRRVNRPGPPHVP